MQELVNQNNMLKRQVNILEQQEDVSNDQRADTIKEQLDYEIERLKRELMSETEKSKKWEQYGDELKINKQKSDNEKNAVMGELNKLKQKVKDIEGRYNQLEYENKNVHGKWKICEEELNLLKDNNQRQEFNEDKDSTIYHQKEDAFNNSQSQVNELRNNQDHDTQEDEYVPEVQQPIRQEEQKSQNLQDSQFVQNLQFQQDYPIHTLGQQKKFKDREETSHHQPQNPTQSYTSTHQPPRSQPTPTQPEHADPPAPTPQPPAHTTPPMARQPSRTSERPQNASSLFNAPPTSGPGLTIDVAAEAEDFFSTFNQPTMVEAMQTPQPSSQPIQVSQPVQQTPTNTK